MKYAICPNGVKDFHCKGLYIAGGKIFNPQEARLVDVPEDNFKECLNCGEALVECIGSCGCVKEHSERCKAYVGPD